jgi:hypothetical protein
MQLRKAHTKKDNYFRNNLKRAFTFFWVYSQFPLLGSFSPHPGSKLNSGAYPANCLIILKALRYIPHAVMMEIVQSRLSNVSNFDTSHPVLFCNNTGSFNQSLNTIYFGNQYQ